MLAMPETSDRSTAGEIFPHSVRLDLSEIQISHGSTECLQDSGFGAETRTHRLLEKDILVGEFSQLHIKPPRSKRATSRRPVKSTLA